MIEIVGLILAILGIVFAFETPRKYFIAIFRGRLPIPEIQPEQISIFSNSLPSAQPAEQNFGASQSGRYPFFISKPLTDISTALAKAKLLNRPVFLVIYDFAHPTQSQLYYSLGCFLDYFTTKKLVDDYFVAALISSNSDKAAKLVPSDNPLENCLWVVMTPQGEIIRSEGVYANADEGLKRVREVIAKFFNEAS